MTLPAFETSRLTLRSITAHDAEGLHEAYGDPDAMRHWDHPPSRNVSQTAERIRMSADADPRWHGMWAIQTHAGRFVGAINYHAHNEQQRRLALGWIVAVTCSLSVRAGSPFANSIPGCTSPTSSSDSS